MNDNGQTGQTTAPNGAGEVQRKTVVLQLAFARWGIQRRVTDIARDGDAENTDAAVHVKAQPDTVRVSKRLLDAPSYQAILRLDGEARREITRLSLRSPLRAGMYLLPVLLVERALDYLAGQYAKRAALVDDFLAAYTDAVEQARADLGALFDQGDYPSPARVRSCFAMQWAILALDVPRTLQALRAGLWESERVKLQGLWQTAAREVSEGLADGMRTLVARLRDRLGYAPDGRPLIVRESAVEALREFLALFPSQNVTGDADLAALADKARGLLDGVDVERLRETGPARDAVRAGLAEIAASVESLVTTRQRRVALPAPSDLAPVAASA